MDERKEISPTLAEFLQVPYYTKMDEEDVVLRIWDYLITKRLFIDHRTIVLDDMIKPVMHPFFYWRDNDCQTEHTIIMVFIVKMHMDPEFIERDVEDRLERIRKKIAVRKIVKFLKTHKKPQYDRNQVWLQYLVEHYSPISIGSKSNEE